MTDNWTDNLFLHLEHRRLLFTFYNYAIEHVNSYVATEKFSYFFYANNEILHFRTITFNLHRNKLFIIYIIVFIIGV